MMFWQAVGVGVGIGIVHSSALFVVLALARSNAKKREDEAEIINNETMDLMRERNELDRQKVVALELLRDAVASAN